MAWCQTWRKRSKHRLSMVSAKVHHKRIQNAEIATRILSLRTTGVCQHHPAELDRIRLVFEEICSHLREQLLNTVSNTCFGECL